MITRAERARWRAWATDADAPPETWLPRTDFRALLDALDAADALRVALRAAEQHLEYCGYGDKWERECAKSAKLPEQIANALTAYDALIEPKG